MTIIILCDTVPQYHWPLSEPIPKVLVEASVSFDINKKLFLHDGSISELDCDAIVVTANKMLRKMPGKKGPESILKIL